VIAYIAEVGPHREVDAWHVTVFEAARHLLRRSKDTPKSHQLAPQVENARDFLPAEQGVKRASAA
jgi:hypothetical protein